MSRSAIMLITGLAIGSPAIAEDNRIKVSGFLSTGVTSTDNSDWVYRGGFDNKPNYFADSVIGLNIFGEISESMEVVTQLLGFPGPTSDFKLDWAFLALHFWESVSIRAGRQKLPIWLVSDHIDVGFAYPWARPPEEVYALNPLSAFQGFSAQSVTKLGSYDVIFEPYFGATEAVIKTFDAENKTKSIPGSAKKIAGASINLRGDSFLLRASYLQTEISFELAPGAQLERKAKFMSLGVKGEIANVVFYSEYAKTGSELNDEKIKELEGQFAQATAAGQTDAAGGIAQTLALEKAKYLGQTSYYATLGYRMGRFLPHLTLASIDQPEEAPTSGDQTSTGLGLRTSIGDGVAAKIEVKQIRPKDGMNGLFAANAADPTPQIGNVNLFSFTLDAVF